MKGNLLFSETKLCANPYNAWTASFRLARVEIDLLNHLETFA
jgi:hypothetical protein